MFNLNKNNSEIKEYKPVIVFLLKALLLYIVWELLYYNFLYESNLIDKTIISSLKYITIKLLHLLGFETFHNVRENHFGIADSSGLIVGAPCDGLDLMYLYLAFFIAVPGKLKVKLSFSVVGLFVIYVFNVIRLVFLALISKYNYESFNFHHSYTFTLLMYLVIFMMWFFYLKKYAFKKD